MAPENLSMGMFSLSQTVVGILGNSSVLFHYFISLFSGKYLMPKDEILKHLTLANSLCIISRGIPQTMTLFGFQSFLDDIACKFIVYSNRVSREVSLHTMCSLSCFQAITISPSNSRWGKLKQRAIKYIVPSCSLSWPVYLFLNSKIAMMVGRNTNLNFTKKFNVGYCSSFDIGGIPLYLFLICFIDIFYLSVMAWASVSMVSILNRHKKQVLYLRSSHHCLRVSPEARATQVILILVCIYVTFYSMTFILIFYTVFFNRPKLWLLHIFAFLESCFPTFCPFLLITKKTFYKICFS
ncbi:vomeronasal type-1 receptor 3-like [Alexandromys fortis]|uniref:vomeronasal type-1 receptor 3-like n=1 Tax=Alexandromys fortis TaxID=100897 RepID=UPI002152167D|nr:vomeronasal type-1 receptor 3-like [Microtus fortis]